MTLQAYYESQGIPYHIGKEHPALEQYALSVLWGMGHRHVLELGYQAGGFAVPIIYALSGRPTFYYCGVDSLAYANAVRPQTLMTYLQDVHTLRGVNFIQEQVEPFLRSYFPHAYDLVLMDHAKRDYPLALWYLLHRGWVAKGGVVLIHDVLGKAKGPIAWVCRLIATVYGYSWTVIDTVPEGLAVLRKP